MAQIPEPMMGDDMLREAKDETEWGAKMLRELARQLTVRNDFYYPLLGVARHLELEK